MKKIALGILIVLTALTGCKIKNRNSSKTEDYDINSKDDFSDIHYQIDLTYEDRNIDAEMTIEFISKVSNEENLNTLVFHLYGNSYSNPIYYPSLGTISAQGSTTIEYVEDSQGNRLEFNYTKSKQAVVIDLKETLKYQQKYNFLIKFQTTVPISDSRFGCLEGICSVTQWYPLMAKYSSLNHSYNKKDYSINGESDYVNDASYTVNIQSSLDYSVVASGVETTTENSNMKTTTAEIEHARNFVFIISKNVVIETFNVADYQIKIVYDEDDRNQVNNFKNSMIDKVKDALIYFETTIGEFVYKDDFDIVATAVEGFAMEYSGLIQMGDLFNYSNDEILIHEIAHQYFYGIIGSDSYNTPFIDEGFTSFITNYYLESLNIVSNTYYAYNQRYQNPISANMEYFDNRNSIDYSLAVYYGTPTLLRELNNKYSKIEELLKLIYDRFKFQIINREELLELVAEVYDDSIAKKFSENLDKKYPKSFY